MKTLLFLLAASAAIAQDYTVQPIPYGIQKQRNDYFSSITVTKVEQTPSLITIMGYQDQNFYRIQINTSNRIIQVTPNDQ